MKQSVRVTIDDLEASAKDDKNGVYYYGFIETFWNGKRECWINVYHFGITGFVYSSIEDCDAAATVGEPKRLYRIHVRMK